MFRRFAFSAASELPNAPMYAPVPNGAPKMRMPRWSSGSLWTHAVGALSRKPGGGAFAFLLHAANFPMLMSM
eukprot:4641371-Pyramimonas_sp.AAC.1